MSSYISGSDVSVKHPELSAPSKDSLSDAESPTLAAYPRCVSHTNMCNYRVSKEHASNTLPHNDSMSCMLAAHARRKARQS